MQTFVWPPKDLGFVSTSQRRHIISKLVRESEGYKSNHRPAVNDDKNDS